VKDFSGQIAEIIASIPTGTFTCEPGCMECCNRHAWSWAEWKKVADDKRREASNIDARCPYATDAGCECYDQRPIICRLFGLADGIGTYGPFENVSLKCPKGLEPTTKLSRQEARAIFLQVTEIRDKEARERMRSGAWPAFAGPYGRIMSEAYAKGQSI
jgi:uncharacterized protein